MIFDIEGHPTICKKQPAPFSFEIDFIVWCPDSLHYQVALVLIILSFPVNGFPWRKVIALGSTNTDCQASFSKLITSNREKITQIFFGLDKKGNLIEYKTQIRFVITYLLFLRHNDSYLNVIRKQYNFHLKVSL